MCIQLYVHVHVHCVRAIGRGVLVTHRGLHIMLLALFPGCQLHVYINCMTFDPQRMGGGPVHVHCTCSYDVTCLLLQLLVLLQPP